MRALGIVGFEESGIWGKWDTGKGDWMKLGFWEKGFWENRILGK